MTALITTKTLIPRSRPQSVARERLVARMSEGQAGGVTLVCAPAGFGKTTLVAGWARTRTDALWLSLDEGDQDALTFLAYLVEALQGLSEAIGASAAVLLRSASPPPVADLLPLLVNDLARWTTPFALVLDDWHLAASDEAAAVLGFLVDHLPPALHLVLTTRQEPALPLGRLRAGGRLTEIRRDDLKFQPDEARSFLTQGMGLGVTETQAEALAVRTEGWPAGLQLAALALRGRDDLAGSIAALLTSDRFVEDYLFEEVLGRQSEDHRRFLRRTASLETFSAPLCDAVLDRSDSRSVLDALDRANLFLVPLDDEGRWYRYHHLFGDLLRRTGAEGLDPAADHRRASQWYAGQGRALEAFGQAVAAGDVDLASRRVEAEGMPLYFQGVLAPVIGWLRALTPKAFAGRPHLAVKLAWALLLSGRHGQVEAEVAAAEAGLDPVGTDGGQDDLWGQLFTLRAFVAIAHRQAEAIQPLAERALGLLAAENQAVRTAALCAAGVGCQYRGDRAGAERAYEALIPAARSAGNRMFALAGSIALGNLLVGENRLHRAAEVFRFVVDTVADPSDTILTEAYLGLARIHGEWNELDAAEDHLGQAARLAGQIDCDTGVAVEALRGRLLLARGDARAEGVLVRALETATRHGWALRASDAARWLVVAQLRAGKTEAASRLAPTHQLATSRARVALAQGDAPAAQALLEAWLTAQAAGAPPEDRLAALIVLALAAQAAGAPDRATSAMEAALEAAFVGGLVLPFIEEGEPMAALLARPAHRGLGPLADRVVAAFGAPRRPGGPPPGLTEALSDREREVLVLLDQGLSNQQAADRLFVSLNTVKWHVQNLFGKLQVQRRTEALAKARGLGLLETIP